ncbi:MAG: Hydroxyacylglutathione hydrolase [Methanoregula sp. PtaU1.Bin051]|nr:MAG: Hydroxyacylglutathione hydrolase [Methanoregula sp. PtaU1.Bin051]
MHAGDTKLAHGSWQPLPGIPGATIYPYIRKIDTVSSNSYIIRSGDLVAVIDPGGLSGQADELCAIIKALPEGTAQAVIVLLTHAHIDHCRVLTDHPFFSNPDHALIAVQEDGARALAETDSRLTQAALMGLTLEPVTAAFRLFAGPGTEGDGRAEILMGSSGPELRLSTDYMESGDCTQMAVQILQTDRSCPIMVYHTPGHSPDSICIRIGSLLFIGDLMFAASPGIAGISGWDREALIRSIDEILALLREGGITHCCPGHGNILTCAEAIRVLEGVKKDAGALDGIGELDEARAKETAMYAEGLMDEVSEIFTIISARLLFVSHVLDELEEAGEAGNVASLIDADRIDALLADFQQFLSAYRAGSNRDIHLALKAGQVVAKLDRMFDAGQLELVLDPAYVRRAGRLLCDYSTVLRGFCQPRMLQDVEVGPLVADLIGQLKQGSASYEDLLDLSDDPTAFARALVKRIARVPVFDDVTCSCLPSSFGRPVQADSAILSDIVRTLLEDITGSGAGNISVEVSGSDCVVSVIVEVNAPGRMPEFRNVRKRFLADECIRGGGQIVWPQDTGSRSVRIDLPVAGKGT